MNKFNRLTRLMLISLALLVSACQIGSADFSTVSGEFNFSPDGTVFGWVENSQKGENLKVMMTWINIEPERELSELSIKQITKIKQQFLDRDRLLLTFSDVSALKTNQSFRSGYGLKAEAWFAASLSGNNPDGLMIGQEQIADCTIDEIISDASGLKSIRGRIDLWITPAQNDAKDALSAHFHGSFEAPIMKNTQSIKRNLNLLMTPSVK